MLDEKDKEEEEEEKEREVVEKEYDDETHGRGRKGKKMYHKKNSDQSPLRARLEMTQPPATVTRRDDSRDEVRA